MKCRELNLDQVKVNFNEFKYIRIKLRDYKIYGEIFYDRITISEK